MRNTINKAIEYIGLLLMFSSFSYVFGELFSQANSGVEQVAISILYGLLIIVGIKLVAKMTKISILLEQINDDLQEISETAKEIDEEIDSTESK